MDPFLLLLLVLLVLVVLTGGSWRSRDLGVPWGSVIAVLVIVLLLRLLGWI